MRRRVALLSSAESGVEVFSGAAKVSDGSFVLSSVASPAEDSKIYSESFLILYLTAEALLPSVYAPNLLQPGNENSTVEMDSTQKVL